MTSSEKNPTREELLRDISRSASYGNLGLFIGAGFCKAVLNEDCDIALSWMELLKQSAKELEVGYDDVQKIGASYPEIASRICGLYVVSHDKSFDEAVSRLKGVIADLTCWYPNREKREQFSGYFDAFSPAWIITTNYDLVIESLLTGKSLPLGPKDILTNPRGTIPVYHLHGIRTNPEEIIITQEDYVSLFRPNEYRQIKLALTVKESTTLFMGYGLGDVNVLTALDWSNHVFPSEKPNYPHQMIQILQTDNPKESPYKDRNGILVLETSDLVGFFKEYEVIRNEEKKKEEEDNKRLSEILKSLENPEENLVEKFIDDKEYRKDLIHNLSSFPIPLASGFISMLDKCIDETWKRSEPKGAFEGYNQNLCMILDILTLFDFAKIPPALFQTSAYGLERLAHYIGEETGQSYSANRTWEARKNELSKEMVQQLINVANRHQYLGIKRLLSEIHNFKSSLFI